jgi:hypothetical protein
LDELGDSHRLRSRDVRDLSTPAGEGPDGTVLRGKADAIAGLEKALDAMIGKALE